MVSLLYINKFLALATQEKLESEILYAYQFLGSSYLNDQNFQKSLEFYLKAHDFVKIYKE